jgi:hypothetical protein
MNSLAIGSGKRRKEGIEEKRILKNLEKEEKSRKGAGTGALKSKISRSIKIRNMRGSEKGE